MAINTRSLIKENTLEGFSLEITAQTLSLNHYVTKPLADIVQTIFIHCQSKCEWESIQALACVNKHYYQCAKEYWKQFDLELFCPELTILDADTLGITIDDEPLITKLALLKRYQKLAHLVENNEGLTLLTMYKGLTLNDLVEMATSMEMAVDDMWDQILPKLGDVPIEQTYVILITNSVFVETRGKYYALLEKCVAKHGCELPTVQESLALCVFSNLFFEKCRYGQYPRTFGYTSTHFPRHKGTTPLMVGDCSADRVFIHDFQHHEFEDYGAGGRQKL